MLRLLIVTTDRERVAEMASRLSSDPDLELLWADTAESAIAEVRRHSPQAAVIDEELPDVPGLELVRRLLPINAMLLTAVMSDMTHERFHEASEGLGIASQLPSHPKAAEAGPLLERFRRLSVF